MVGLLAKQGDADDADIVGSSGTRRVRCGCCGEGKRRDLIVALAPTADLVALPGIEHIASLVPAGILTRDHIDAVDRGDCEQPLTDLIADVDRIVSARRTGN